MDPGRSTSPIQDQPILPLVPLPAFVSLPAVSLVPVVLVSTFSSVSVILLVVSLSVVVSLLVVADSRSTYGIPTTTTDPPSTFGTGGVGSRSLCGIPVGRDRDPLPSALLRTRCGNGGPKGDLRSDDPPTCRRGGAIPLKFRVSCESLRGRSGSDGGVPCHQGFPCPDTLPIHLHAVRTTGPRPRGLETTPSMGASARWITRGFVVSPPFRS
jgi:hypothetical protein